MKKYILLLISLYILIGCSKQTQEVMFLENHTITNSNYSYSIAIPNHWEGKYKYQIREGNIWFRYVSKDEQFSPTIFFIQAISNNTTGEFESNPENEFIKLGERSGVTYYSVYPLDFELDSQSEIQEYNKMLDEVKKIIQTFKFIKNELPNSSYEYPLYTLKSSFTYSTPFGVGGENYYSPYLLTYANKILNELNHLSDERLYHIEEIMLEELINKADEVIKGSHIGPLNEDYFLGIEVDNNFVELGVRDISELVEVWFFINDEKIIILLNNSRDWIGLAVQDSKLNNMWKEELETLLYFTDELHSLFWKEHF
jgi:hypothetical protein